MHMAPKKHKKPDSVQTQTERVDADDMHVDTSLRSFIRDQIDALQRPLGVPEQEELACSQAEYKQVERAVAHVNATLFANRQRHLDQTILQAVIEQIEGLRASERGKAKIVRLDEQLKLFVDRDDWLEDLPPAWPTTTQMEDGEEVDIPREKLEEYSRLYRAAQTARQRRHTLKQKTEHYKLMEELLSRKLKA